jgi:hypothetical protein
MAQVGQIPRYVKHVTMAILKKRGIHSFEAALDIARAQLTKFGYLAAGSDKGPPARIKLTAEGRKKNREFARRPMRMLLEFDRAYQKSKWGGKDLSEREAGSKSED